MKLLQRRTKREPFFFTGNNQQKLFGIAHLPENREVLSSAVLFCSPFAEEKLNSHRVFYNFANLLASKGILAMRFDYWGTGDSGGDFEQTTLSSRTQNIVSACSECRKRYNVESIALIGLRLGGNLALKALQTAGANCSIAWAPFPDVYKYLYDLLRANLSTQVARYKKVIKNREQLIADLKAGQFVNTDGYDLSWALFEQAPDYSLAHLLSENQRHPLLLIDIVKSSKRPTLSLKRLINQTKNVPGNVSLNVVQEIPFWNSGIPQYVVNPTGIFDMSMGWLLQQLRGS